MGVLVGDPAPSLLRHAGRLQPGLRTDAIVLLCLRLIGPAASRVLPESQTAVECDQTAGGENGARHLDARPGWG